MKNNMRIFMIAVVLVLMLFVLSSCYSYNQVSEMIDEKEEEWSEKYSVLEEKYYSASSRVDELESALGSISDDFATVYCYYDHALDDITEAEALSALSRIHNKLNELGY